MGVGEMSAAAAPGRSTEPGCVGSLGLHELIVRNFTQALANLAHQIDRGAAHAEQGGPELSRLLGARLAPDMHPLSAQIAYACLQAMECVSRLLGQPLPSVPDASTPALARSAIEEAIAKLWECDQAALDRSADRPLELTLPVGLTFELTGRTYVRDWAVPQFYFHLVVAYAILRSQGVPLGKADYVPHMERYLKASAHRP